MSAASEVPIDDVDDLELRAINAEIVELAEKWVDGIHFGLAKGRLVRLRKAVLRRKKFMNELRTVRERATRRAQAGAR